MQKLLNMNENIKFSVTIPAYKDCYLREAIDSVLEQTYHNYEIVIVNDASPYDLDSIVWKYTDSRIRYYKNKTNCGAKDVVDNWNKCLAYATGEFIICMGDDDKLTPNCLQFYSDLINKYPNMDLYHTRTEIMDDDFNYIRTLEERPEWESVYSLIYSHRSSFIGDWLFRTSTLRNKGGFYKLPYGWSSDYITAYIMATSHGVANTNEVGFQYRGNSQSISHDLTCIEEKIEAIHSAMKWIMDFVASKHPDNEEDRHIIKLIKHNYIKYTHRDIDDMIEFDIRKNFGARGWYWLTHRKQQNISFYRYFRCVIKAIKYKLKYK